MAKRKGFVVYFEWVDMMRELDGETFKRLILDMRSYADTGRAPEYLKEEEKLLRMAWALLQNRMDADADRYADIVQKRKEAALAWLIENPGQHTATDIKTAVECMKDVTIMQVGSDLKSLLADGSVVSEKKEGKNYWSFNG